MPISDPIKRKEYMKEYSKKHYQANKGMYNPGRAMNRERESSYWCKVARIAKTAIDSSFGRWVGPHEVKSCCKKSNTYKYGRGDDEMFLDVVKLIEKRKFVHGRGFIDWDGEFQEVGMFMGGPTFKRSPPYFYEAFNKKCPKKKRDDCAAEILILQLTAKSVEADGGWRSKNIRLGA